MRNKSGMTFADVLILLAIVLLLATLAVPRFIKAPDYGNEEDELQADSTNTTESVFSPTNTASSAQP